MNHRTTAAALLAAAALALTGCSADDTADAKPTKSATKDKPSAKPSPDMSKAEKAAGIPPEPTGQQRQALLKVLASVNPGVVNYEDKAIDAARNQCAAINGGAQKLDWTASQRFTFKDVKTTEAQGKQINQALKASGFCKS